MTSKNDVDAGWRIWRYESNLCFEISKDHRRKRGSSQEGEKGKDTGEIRQREWKHKSVRKKRSLLLVLKELQF